MNELALRGRVATQGEVTATSYLATNAGAIEPYMARNARRTKSVLEQELDDESIAMTEM